MNLAQCDFKGLADVACRLRAAAYNERNGCSGKSGGTVFKLNTLRSLEGRKPVRNSRVTGPMLMKVLAALAVFFMALGGRASAYTHRVLYSFCAQDSCADGDGPIGSLLMDSTGTLYGTTYGGGGQFNDGTVFALVPNGGGYDYRVFHQFCLVDGCPDGAHPDQEIDDYVSAESCFQKNPARRPAT